MNFEEIGKLVEVLSKERGIKREFVIEAIEQAFLAAARKKYGIQGEYEAKYNNEESDIEIFQFKTAAETVRDPVLEMTLDEAKELDENCELGDQLGMKIENPEFTRVDIQTVKQIIFQRVRDAERDVLFSEFKHREGELVTGIARRLERGNVIVDLGKADAILSRREIIYGERFNPGDRIQAYLSEVVMTNRGPEIRLSRTSPMFLVKLFEVEVPEVQDGTIEIRSAARDPGQRAKIAVFTNDRDIDPVGACVGMKGSRVQNIVNELQGEKIDIVRWSEDLETYLRTSMSPAEITSVMINKDDQTIDVVVEDEQLALSIGRRGQNVRLTAMLLGWKVNIISKSKLQNKINKSVENLQQADSIHPANAQVLVHGGIMSLSDLSQAEAEAVGKMLVISAEEAQKYITAAQETLQREDVQPEVILTEEDEIVAASAIADNHGFHQPKENKEEDEKTRFNETEQRLREELAAFKLK